MLAFCMLSIAVERGLPVEKNGHTFSFDDHDIAWNVLVWSSTPENDQVSEIVHIDARVVTQARIPARHCRGRGVWGVCVGGQRGGRGHEGVHMGVGVKTRV